MASCSNTEEKANSNIYHQTGTHFIKGTISGCCPFILRCSQFSLFQSSISFGGCSVINGQHPVNHREMRGLNEVTGEVVQMAVNLWLTRCPLCQEGHNQDYRKGLVNLKVGLGKKGAGFLLISETAREGKKEAPLMRRCKDNRLSQAKEPEKRKPALTLTPSNSDLCNIYCILNTVFCKLELSLSTFGHILRGGSELLNQIQCSFTAVYGFLSKLGNGN